MSGKTMTLISYYFFILYISVPVLSDSAFEGKSYSTELTFIDIYESDEKQTTESESPIQPPEKKSTIVSRVNDLSQTLKDKDDKKLTRVERKKHLVPCCEMSTTLGDQNVKQTTNTTSENEQEQTASKTHENTLATDHDVAIFDQQVSANLELLPNKDLPYVQIRQSGEFFDAIVLRLLVTSLFCLTIVMMLTSIGVILYIGVSTVDKARKFNSSKSPSANNAKFGY